MSKPKKQRWWCVTVFEPYPDYEKVMSDNNIRFIAYGKETCPTSGKSHHQLYCYFRNDISTSFKSCSRVGKMFTPDKPSHSEPMAGLPKHSEKYCSKEGELIKLGNEPKQGARTDIMEQVDLLKNGDTTPDEICLINPEFFHQYGRTLDRVHQIMLRKQFRKKMTKGIWIHGPAGSGKSHKAFDMENWNPDNTYSKNLNEDWWDGYTGQKRVIFNEFRGDRCKFSELLDLVDKYPKTVRIRNREPVPFLAEELIITSIHSPRDAYSGLQIDEPWAQFDRRFKVIKLEERKKSALTWG